ncbi:MAG: hypothetical protein NTW53_01900 [Burkholderiales bacterium]|nr:hypothetical protein [Burkholderiales bacterium]
MTANRSKSRSTILSSVCFAALLSVALPAKALVLTYNSWAPDWDTSAATGNPNQTRSLPLPKDGGAISGTMSAIFIALDKHFAGTGNNGNPVWTPVGQFGSDSLWLRPTNSVPLGPYSQRFDYTLPYAADQSTSVPTHTWNNTFRLERIGSFYLDNSNGSTYLDNYAGWDWKNCIFCGPDNLVSFTDTPFFNGTASYVGTSYLPEYINCVAVGYCIGAYTTKYESSAINIKFGSSGITGTMKFSTELNEYMYANGNGGFNAGGQIILEIPDGQTGAVPAPAALSLLLTGLGILGLQRRRAA